MYGQFTPMSSATVQLAKNYRDDQIRAAEQSRLVAQFRTPRTPLTRRITRTWTAAVSHLRHPQVTARSTHTARTAH